MKSFKHIKTIKTIKQIKEIDEKERFFQQLLLELEQKMTTEQVQFLFKYVLLKNKNQKVKFNCLQTYQPQLYSKQVEPFDRIDTNLFDSQRKNKRYLSQFQSKNRIENTTKINRQSKSRAKCLIITKNEVQTKVEKNKKKKCLKSQNQSFSISYTHKRNQNSVSPENILKNQDIIHKYKGNFIYNIFERKTTLIDKNQRSFEKIYKEQNLSFTKSNILQQYLEKQRKMQNLLSLKMSNSNPKYSKIGRICNRRF